jgi:phage regulator Rha-like protein
MNLINLEQHDDEMRVSSRLLSEGVGTSYKATNNLIRKHQNRLETFGELPFKKALKGESSRIKPALLNEDQAIFLVTLSRNTEQVVEFKHQLITAFSMLRRKQALIDANHAKFEWQQNRALGKYQRHDITGTIQQFIDYAKAQGSRGAGHYFINITNCVNKALGIEDRDKAGEDMLALLAVAEIVAERVLLEGMSAQLPYKNIYEGIKQQITIFAAMVADEEVISD